jgi:hypothetical protein
MKIYKFTLNLTGEQDIQMPSGAKILSTHEQFGDITLWCLCDPKNMPEYRKIFIYATGEPLPKDIQTKSFIGTVLTDAGNFVWHLYE